MSKFELKDKIDCFFYQGFNIISDLFFYSRPWVSKAIKSNSKFENVHRGRRCFILGTGPSLSTLPESVFLKLSKEITFGVNSLYKADCANFFDPNYYVLVDTKYLDVSSGEYVNVFRRFASNPPVLITDHRARSCVSGLEGFQDIMWLHQKHFPTNAMRIDMAKNSSITMNVVGTAIQSAMYMGFSEIYLLGCDYNAFCNFGHGHCYDDTEELKKLKLPNYNLGFYLKYYHLTTEFHYLLRNFAEINGIKIVNLTDGSLLDAYRRQSVKSVLN